jgi:hypothetical protein
VGRFTIVLWVCCLVNIFVAVLPVFTGLAVLAARLLGREEDGVANTVGDSTLVHKSSPRLTLGILLLIVFLFDGAKRLEFSITVDLIVELANLTIA